MSQEARLSFLKNPEALRSHYGNQDQEQEDKERDREETVNSGENLGLGQEDFQEQEDDPDFVPSPPCSQRNSVESSKSVMIRGRSYQSQKERINKMIAKLEADPERF